MHAARGGFAQCLSRIWLRGEFANRGGQLGKIVRFEQNSGLAVANQFRSAADAGSHDTTAASHCL